MQEFSNIIRRAFATRLFPPEVVDKLGKYSLSTPAFKLERNFRMIL